MLRPPTGACLPIRCAPRPVRQILPARSLRRAILPLLLAIQVLAHAQPARPAGAPAVAPAIQTSAAAAPAAPSSAAMAAATSPAPPAAHPVDGPSFAPMVLALLVVLLLMGAALWVLRRVGLAPRPGSANLLRLVGQLTLGPRERVVIVEVADRWLLLGVGTGGISRLGSLPKGESAVVPAQVATFGTLLEKLRKGTA
jgi:flagellar protein FliO/FliZ